MKRVLRIDGKGKVQDVAPQDEGAALDLQNVDPLVELIQACIPLAARAARELLAGEVVALAGRKHARRGRRPGHVRWSQERGSIYLLDQKLPITYTRVRNRLTNTESP